MYLNRFENFCRTLGQLLLQLRVVSLLNYLVMRLRVPTCANSKYLCIEETWLGKMKAHSLIFTSSLGVGLLQAALNQIRPGG